MFVVTAVAVSAAQAPPVPAQKPPDDAEKALRAAVATTVRGKPEAVDLAVADVKNLITEFEEVSAKLGEPMDADEMEKLLDKQGRLQDQIDAEAAIRQQRHAGGRYHRGRSSVC